MGRRVRVVADDDPFVREALRRLLEAAGIGAADAFASPSDLRSCAHHESCDCLLLSVWVPDPRCTPVSESAAAPEQPAVLIQPNGPQRTQ